MAGAPDLLELPTDRPRPAVQGLDTGRFSFPLDKQLSEGLFDFCRKQGCTLQAFFVAAFQSLLSRYTEQREILVGVRFPKSSRAECQSIDRVL